MALIPRVFWRYVSQDKIDRALDCCFRFVGPAFSSFFVFAYTFVASAHLVIVMPAASAPWWGWMLSIFLVFAVGYFFVRAAFTKPGFVIDQSSVIDAFERAQQHDVALSSQTEGLTSRNGASGNSARGTGSGNEEHSIVTWTTVAPSGRQRLRFCKHCKSPKPPRAHHCDMMGRCVLRMDHHCSLVNNTIGLRNHRYFALLMVYMFLAATWSAYVTEYWFSKAKVCKTPLEIGVLGLIEMVLRPLPCTHLLLAISLALVIGMAAISGWTLYCIAKGLTTVELEFHMMTGRTTNPYNAGLCENWKQVFGNGRYWYVLWLWPDLLRQECDGMDLPLHPKFERSV